MKHKFIPVLFLLLITFLIYCRSQRSSYQEDASINIDSVYQKILKDSILVTGWYYIAENDNGFKRQLDKSDEVYYIDPKPIVVKENFKSLKIYETNFKGVYPDYVGLEIRFDNIGTKSWAEATEKSITQNLAFIIDNVLMQTPKVNAQILNGVAALNRGDYSKVELENLILLIKN